MGTWQRYDAPLVRKQPFRQYFACSTGESTFFHYCIVRERGREQIIRVRHYATGSTQTCCQFTRLAVLEELATNVQKETVTSMREREYQPLINQSWKTEVDHACLLMPSGADPEL